MPIVHALVEANVHDGQLVTLHDCVSREMATCLVEECTSSLWEEFLPEAVATVLYVVMEPCICLCSEEARNSCVEVISAALCFCLCIRLDIYHLLWDCVSDASMYPIEGSAPCDQERTNRRYCLGECLEERGRGRVLEVGHGVDRWNVRQGGRCHPRSGRSLGR